MDEPWCWVPDPMNFTALVARFVKSARDGRENFRAVIDGR